MTRPSSGSASASSTAVAPVNVPNSRTRLAPVSATSACRNRASFEPPAIMENGVTVCVSSRMAATVSEFGVVYASA